ncbi:hypothetical protein FF1_026891 [Malus domestica]
MTNVILSYDQRHLEPREGSLQILSSVHSNCPSQIFPNTSYNECDDLPTLNSRLYWLFDPSISSLSIAFTAPPAEPEGWIAWGINPISTGMLGAQVLVAFRQPIGSITVKTFHLTSYTILVEAPFDFEVRQMSAEASTGLGFITIFVTIRMPENIQTLNLVWQVGAAVSDGVPLIHELNTNNLHSRKPLTIRARGQKSPEKKITGLVVNIVIGIGISLFVALVGHFCSRMCCKKEQIGHTDITKAATSAAASAATSAATTAATSAATAGCG